MQIEVRATVDVERPLAEVFDFAVACERGVPTWTYVFSLTTPLVYPLAWLVLGLFRSWMQSGLDQLRAQLPAR